MFAHCRGLAGCKYAVTSAAQAAWPERPVTIVTPFAPGGIADVVARLTAERLQVALKQPFIVENVDRRRRHHRAERVAKAAPDGYTLMSTPIFQLTMAPFTQNVTFDARRDFKPISAVASSAIRDHRRLAHFQATRSPSSSPT